MINRPPLPADETLLITAWYGGDSNAVIARTLGIKPSQLDSAWRRLKREGKVPNGARQPAGPARSARPVSDIEHDNKPDIAARSHLFLEKLKEVHGADGRPDLIKFRKR
jgi:transposase-like protein